MMTDLSEIVSHREEAMRLYHAYKAALLCPVELQAQEAREQVTSAEWESFLSDRPMSWLVNRPEAA